MMPTNSNIKCFVALALVVCASLVASLPAASDPDTVVPEAAVLTQSSDACKGLNGAVNDFKDAAQGHPNWAESDLPKDCVDCLETDNNGGCGLFPCANEDDMEAVKTVFEAAKASGTPPNWSTAQASKACLDCLDTDNNGGCGLPAPGGGEGHPDAACIECIMDCDYVKTHNCGPDKEETDECSMDLIGQNCGEGCASSCSDPEGSGGKSSGGEGSGDEKGICDHIDPEMEFGERKCCKEEKRHDQNTCILADIGPCDPPMTSEKEPCCGEATPSDQAECYCAKTSPDQNPCCALSTHEGQAACAAYMIHHQTDNSILDGGNSAPAFMSFAQTSGSH